MLLNEPIKYKRLIEFLGFILYVLGSVLSVYVWIVASIIILDFIKFEHFFISIISFILGFGVTLLLFAPFVWVFSKFEFDRDRVCIFLYVKFNLKTKISYKEIENVEVLFYGNLCEKNWFPMDEVLRVKKNKRMQYLIDYINNEYNISTSNGRV